MQPKTISERFTKIAPVVCLPQDPLADLAITGHCFWLGILRAGRIRLSVDGREVEAVAPCFLCLDERASVYALEVTEAVCDSVYFHPTFLNVNMTFSRIHDETYADIAPLHDLFLLMPFTDEETVTLPLLPVHEEGIQRAYAGMMQELTEQRDWFWSCRSRSYFMELMLLLERAYGYGVRPEAPALGGASMEDPLQAAVFFIESHYHEHLTRDRIVEAVATNHTTLTRRFKEEMGMTPMEYLWHHRIRVAKKQLEFTALSVGEIAGRCGFQTVQHFRRKFEEATGYTPVAFREVRFRRRVEELGGAGMGNS